MIWKKRNKFGAIKAEVDGYRFDSMREAEYYKELKLRVAAKEISLLQVHPEYSIEIAGVHIGTVILDFAYRDNKGVIHYEDTKGKDTALSRFKRKCVQAQYSIVVEVVK
jgi:hypothetical protein